MIPHRTEDVHIFVLTNSASESSGAAVERLRQGTSNWTGPQLMGFGLSRALIAVQGLRLGVRLHGLGLGFSPKPQTPNR